ncbi:MAG: DUF4349 domain-containing protein [Anaerolineales bacterium]|nr:DUF4349 domain-containing protein [Anaerolineales bacterium]
MFSLSKTPTRPIWAWFFIAALLLGACAQMATPEYDKAVGSAPGAPMEAPAEGSIDLVQYSNTTEGSAQAAERIVIKNASLTLVVDDPSKSMSAISQLADEMKGFVVSANMYMQELDSGAQVPRANITIRIPAEQLNAALSRIKSESDQDPLSESISSQDVTSEYVDLQSRLRNLENTEAQLSEIMGSATKTEDVLSVYNRLVEIREQIELTKGQIKYYEESAALSAIDVDLLADEAVQPLTVGGWQPQGVAKSAIQALINTLKFLANAVIWIILFLAPTLLVLYLIFVLPFSLLWRAWRRRRAKRKATVTTVAAEPGKPEQG